MTVRGFPARGDGPFNRASKTAWLAILTCLLPPAQLVFAQPAQSLSEGVQAYYRGDYPAAANLARQLTKTQPGTSDPYVLLARAEASQGNLRQAFEALRQALRINPNDAEALYFLAHVSTGLSQAEHQRLFAMAPNSARVHQILAESYRVQENLPKAEEEYQAALQYQVRKKIGDIRQTLPAEAIGPFYNDEFGDVYGSIYAFTADGFTLSELRDYVERVRQEVLRLPNVSKAELVGVQEDRIFVEISSKRLAALGIDPQSIGQALAAQNAILSPGSVETRNNTVALRVTGQLDSVQAVSDLRLRAGGEGGAQTFRLGDIATVTRGYADPPVSTMRYRGKEALGLAVSMLRRGDVLKLGDDLKRTMARLKLELPVGVEFEQVSDQPSVVRDSVGEFMRSLGEAVAIVLAISFLTLGARTGLVVALTIPLVLAATFFGMYVFGIDLHRISTGALIIALGLLVDDAMIAVEMMHRKLEEGLDKLHAASYAYSTTAFPMLSGTLITAAGFLPIATAKSATGEYTFAIFAVTTMALVISWFAAVIATPFIGSLLLKEHLVSAGERPREMFDTPFYRRLRRVIDWCIENRKTVLAATAASLVLGVLGMKLTEKQFFPSSNRVELMVDLWLPEGASIRASERETERVEKLLAGNPDVASYVSYVGNGSPRFFLSLDQQLFRTNFSQTIVLTQGRGGARAHHRRAAQDAGGGFPGRARAREPRAARPAGQLPGAVPRLRRQIPANSSASPTWWPRRCAPTPPPSTRTSTGATRCSPCASTSTRRRRARWA